MKLKYKTIFVAAAIACFALSFLINISLLWLCTAAVQHLGMTISAAAAAVPFTGLVMLRVWRF